jgi:Trypsin-co-occurring domain 1
VARFVEVPLPDGGSLIVEQVGSGQVVRAGGRVERVADAVGESFESAVDRVKRAAQVVHDRMQEAASPPDEVTVEFALKLAAELGVVVASSSVEANLKLVVRWTKAEEADSS